MHRWQHSGRGARADGLDPIAVRQAGLALAKRRFRLHPRGRGGQRRRQAAGSSAKAIAKWTAVIPTLFPKGTETGGNTKALPEIWSDPAGFQKIAAAATEAAADQAGRRREGRRRRCGGRRHQAAGRAMRRLPQGLSSEIASRLVFQPRRPVSCTAVPWGECDADSAA